MNGKIAKATGIVLGNHKQFFSVSVVVLPRPTSARCILSELSKHTPSHTQTHTRSHAFGFALPVFFPSFIPFHLASFVLLLPAYLARLHLALPWPVFRAKWACRLSASACACAHAYAYAYTYVCVQVCLCYSCVELVPFIRLALVRNSKII